MLGDEDDSKRMAQRQLIMVLMMTMMMIVWFQYFMPPPQQPAQQPAAPGSAAPDSQATAGTPGAPAATPASADDPTKWPFLPPIPTDMAESDNPVLENHHLRLVFTRVGARLKEAHLLLGEDSIEGKQLIPEQDKPDTEAVLPMGLLFTEPQLADKLDYRLFDVVEHTSNSIAFALTVPNAFRVTKSFKLGTDRHNIVEVSVAYQNLEPTPRILGMDDYPAYRLTWGPDVASNDAHRGVEQTVEWRKNGENDWVLTSSMEPEEGRPFVRSVLDAEWIATKSAYFFVAMKPEFPEGQVWTTGLPTNFRFGAGGPRVEIAPQAVDTRQFSVYIGPSQWSYLSQAWDTLPTALRFFDTFNIMDWFAKLLLRMLNWFYSIIPNYGVGIILLTIVVRMVMFPLTLKQIRSMKRMQLLAPEMEELKKKYGNEPQEMQVKMMQLYKERGINPLSGCFPVLLQLPVFVALYRMFLSSFELYRAPFALWITDLAEPDRLFRFPWNVSIPLVGSLEYLNVLPIIGAVVMLLSFKMTPQPTAMQDSTQKMIMNIMPVMFSFMCYNFSSGINLYIITSTVIGIAQSKLIRVTKADLVSLEAEKKKPAAKKRMHWYDAAQAKKKLIAREMKDEARRQAHKGGKGDSAQQDDAQAAGPNGSGGGRDKRKKNKANRQEE